MQAISGREVAAGITERLKRRPVPNKILAAVLVGDNPASTSFLKQKETIAAELGIDFRIYRFPKEIRNDELRKEVGKIASLKKVGGEIVQLPLPEHINKHYILNVIPREKDIDVLGERALGAFYVGRNPVLPPAVGAVEEILRFKNFELKYKKVAVVGPGFLVGKPLVLWFLGKVGNLCVVDEGGDLSKISQADLIVLSVGVPSLIKPEMLKEGARVIDFGCFIGGDGKIHGDFDSSQIEKMKVKNSWYTPTPGGTGPILVAKLFENFYELNNPFHC